MLMHQLTEYNDLGIYSYIWWNSSIKEQFAYIPMSQDNAFVWSHIINLWVLFSICHNVYITVVYCFTDCSQFVNNTEISGDMQVFCDVFSEIVQCWPAYDCRSNSVYKINDGYTKEGGSIFKSYSTCYHYYRHYERRDKTTSRFWR